MMLHEIKRKTKYKTKKRIGRGGSRGKTSGRGTKGQKARAGNSMRPEIRDLIKKLPKRRGYGQNRAKSLGKKVSVAVINVSVLDREFESGQKVTPDILIKKNLVRKVSGSYPDVKILGNGEIKAKLIIMKCSVSKEAKSKIEKAGGSVVLAKMEEKKENK